MEGKGADGVVEHDRTPRNGITKYRWEPKEACKAHWALQASLGLPTGNSHLLRILQQVAGALLYSGNKRGKGSPVRLSGRAEVWRTSVFVAP